MKIAVDILWTLMIFVIIAVALLYIFGAADCEDAADQTAKALKDSINIVAEDSFPSHNGMSVPTSSTEYREVVVRLCQTNTKWSYALSFWGGMPEYQIYYEKFPEGVFNGGSWMWSEDYPWTGSAASSMVFWGVLRTGTYAFKGIAKTLAKTNSLYLTVKGVSYTLEYRSSRIATFFGKDTDEIMTLLKSDPDFVKSLFKPTRNALAMHAALNSMDAELGVGAMKKIGILKLMKGSDGTFDAVIRNEIGTDGLMKAKMVLSNEETPVTITKAISSFDENGNEVLHFQEYPIWSKKNLETGEITEMLSEWDAVQAGKTIADLEGEGFTKETFKPNEAFRELVTELKAAGKTDEANRLLNSFSLDYDPATGTQGVDWFNLKSFKLKDSSIYQELWNPTKNQFTAFLDRIKFAGYDVDKTFMDPKSLKALSLGTKKVLDENPEVAMKLIKLSLTDTTMVKLGISNADELTEQMAKDYIKNLEMNLAGGAFLHKSSVYRVDRIVMNELEANPTLPSTELLDIIKKSDAYKEIYGDITSSGKVFTDADLEGIVGKGYEHISKLDGGVTPAKAIEFETEMNAEFWKRIASEAESTDDAVAKRAYDEFGIMSGFLEKNPSTLPASVTTKFGRREIRKLVYIDGTAMINPNSWMREQLTGNIMTEYCEGNSMCMYSHATQTENPYYMSAKADSYFVRIWRPVPVEMYTSIQGNLMHPTENPRFYLVSPCFGKLKIWKNTETDTIYAYMEKCDTGTSNYCYASEGLLQQYAYIWAASDWGSLLTGFGESKLAKLSKVDKVIAKGAISQVSGFIDKFDPITVAQSAAEAAISWPGYPWEDMTYDMMNTGGKECFSEDIQSSIKNSQDSSSTD